MISLRARAVNPERDRSTNADRSLRLLSIHDAAAYAGVSKTSVRRWIKAGDLRTYRAGRQHRIDETDLIEFLSK